MRPVGGCAPGSDGRVEETGAVEVHGGAALPRSGGGRLELLQGPYAPAGAAVRVLEDDDPARPEIRVLHGFYVLGRYEARLGGHPSHDEPGVDRRAAPLVHEDVRPLFGEEHAPRPRLCA